MARARHVGEGAVAGGRVGREVRPFDHHGALALEVEDVCEGRVRVGIGADGSRAAAGVKGRAAGVDGLALLVDGAGAGLAGEEDRRGEREEL